MLIPLTNQPRDYAWGSRTLIAVLEGREPSAGPEAEVWFGDHPSDPAELDGGITLDRWIAQDGPSRGVTGPLPYLLKLLAADSPLSIQVHPSREQAQDGFARERGLPEGAPRNYADDNHKPEMLVALSDRFEALCGLREVAASRRLLEALGPAAHPLLERLTGDDALPAVLAWLLSGDAQPTVDAIIAALPEARSDEFADALGNARRIAASYPSDPGVIVALLMNYVVLHHGEAVFLRAGMLHAYVSGLGVEIMAASDNVLRGGLTPKHIDVDELVRVLDARPGPTELVRPVAVAAGLEEFPVPVPDFALLRARVSDGDAAAVTPQGPAIVLATAGEVRVACGEEQLELHPGAAAFVTPDGGELRISGDGEAFLAQPGG
ncbi:mannose-6-phosphate isomerase, class I [Microbacterium sp. NPDC003461]